MKGAFKMNNHIESVFADTKDMKMTPEVEQEVNKIYIEKIGIKMKNIKELENVKETILLRLDIVKSIFLTIVPYLKHIESVCKMTNETFNFNLVQLSSRMKEKSKPYIYEMKNQNEFMEEIIKSILANISMCIKEVQSNECTLEDYEYFSSRITYQIEKLQFLLEVYHYHFLSNTSEYYMHIANHFIIALQSLIVMIWDDKYSCTKYSNTDIIDKNLY